MNLDNLWKQQKTLYDSAVRLFGPNSNLAKRRWSELLSTTNRILRRDNRKGKAA